MNTDVGLTAELQDIHKTFRSGLRRRPVPVLQGVDLRIERGEVLALLGLNGAGKTTLMKILLGLARPCRGRGSVLGHPLGDLRARAKVGYQPEQPYLYPALTVTETLELMAGLARLGRADRRRRLAAVIDQCDLGLHAGTRVRKLSRGWLQRLTLASALLADPSLLLLDEPLGGLDPGARMAVKEIIRSLRSAGQTVLISSHILPDLETLADRVALLHRGRIVACGRLGDLLDANQEGFEVGLRSARPVHLDGVCLSAWDPTSGRSHWWLPLEDGEALQTLIAELIAGGVSVRSLSPRRHGLESYFARMTQGDARIASPPASSVDVERPRAAS